MSSDEKSSGDAGTGDGSADLEKLAKEYVDLWEQQIKAFTTDEALARTMAQTMELMNTGAANVAAMMQKAAEQQDGTGQDGTGKAGADDAAGRDAGNDADDDEDAGERKPGAAAAGTASGGAEPDVHELALRVAELERRLARLEGLAEPAGKIASGKTPKR